MNRPRIALVGLLLAGGVVGAQEGGDWVRRESVRGSFLLERPADWTLAMPRAVLEEDDSMVVVTSPDGRVHARFEGNPLPPGELPSLEEELDAFRESLPLLGSPGRPDALRLDPGAAAAEGLVCQVSGTDTSAGAAVEALVAVARTRGYGYRIYIRAPRETWEELGPSCRRLLGSFVPIDAGGAPPEPGGAEAPPEGAPPEGEPPEFPEGVRPLGPPEEDGLRAVAVDRMGLRLHVPAGWEMLPPEEPEEEDGHEVEDGHLLVFTAADPETGSDMVVYLTEPTLYGTSDLGELLGEFLGTYDGVRFAEPEQRVVDGRETVLARGEGAIEGFGPARVLVAITTLPEGAPLPLVIASVEATPELMESWGEALERTVTDIAPAED